MRTAASSGRSAGECSPGERFLCCRRWTDPSVDFEEVVVRGRRGPYVSVEVTSGPEAGEIVNVIAATLWSDDQLGHAKDRRGRDLRIAELDREHPEDQISSLAIEMLCRLAAGDTDVESRATVEAVLAQLGRPTDLGGLHELAYAGEETWAPVAAPAEAWRRLFEEFARSVPGVVEERAAELVDGWSWIGDAERGAALARVRLWAGLPPIAAPLEVSPIRREPDEGKRRRQAIGKAADASLTTAAAPSSEALVELFRAFQDALGDADRKEPSMQERLDISRRTRNLAEPLCGLSARAAQPLMSWLLAEVGIRTPWCDHIVWSDYSAQHPRILHLFPDGHRFPEEEGISRAAEGTLTACGEQILLSWRVARSWTRAAPGEWLEHFEALGAYREKASACEGAGEELPYPPFDPEYDMARRICLQCAAYHGLFLECLESGNETRRWSPWRFAETRAQALSSVLDRLGDGPRITSLQGARRVAMEAWLEAEIAATARELKNRGPGSLRRLFGDRQGRTPSLYKRWGETGESFGLEPHELLSRSLWERVLTESLDLFDQQEVPTGDRRRVRDEIQRVVEARIAGLC
jgi:hypothetical protein